VPFQILESEARSILSPVSGFIQEAGFTHSLTPARNCTFGCSYCYVPTMRLQGGLKPEDWTRWGQFTTLKRNAAELLARDLRPSQTIYCSPLTDPYQPAEEQALLMPGILRAVEARPPRVFTIQTRGSLILRDLPLLRSLASRTTLRIGFTVTTDRDDVRRIFEPRCASIPERLRTVAALRDAGIAVSITLAPVLPCDPDALVDRALEATNGPLVADPFHVRAVKRSGATTREPAAAICRRHGWQEWLDPAFHRDLLARMRHRAEAAGREFGWGPSGFGFLSRLNTQGTRLPYPESDMVRAVLP